MSNTFHLENLIPIINTEHQRIFVHLHKSPTGCDHDPPLMNMGIVNLGTTKRTNTNLILSFVSVLNTTGIITLPKVLMGPPIISSTS